MTRVVGLDLQSKGRNETGSSFKRRVHAGLFQNHGYGINPSRAKCRTLVWWIVNAVPGSY